MYTIVRRATGNEHQRAAAEGDAIVAAHDRLDGEQGAGALCSLEYTQNACGAAWR
jgi:hypothetical protein